jgi:hypothetical protein
MKYTVESKPVLRIRIRMFLGLLDPDLIVRGTDTDPSIIKQNSKKTLDSHVPVLFCVLFDFLSLKNDVNVTSKVTSRQTFLN